MHQSKFEKKNKKGEIIQNICNIYSNTLITLNYIDLHQKKLDKSNPR